MNYVKLERELLLPLLAGLLFVVTAGRPSLASGTSINDWIETRSLSSVYATPSLAGAQDGTQPAGSYGIIVGGPVFSGTNSWWNVQFEHSPNGWINGQFIDISILYPIYCPTLNPTPVVNSIAPLPSGINAPTKIIFGAFGESNAFCASVNNAQQGYYWGRVIGADGIMVAGIGLTTPVGTNTTTAPYQIMKRMQQNYAAGGAPNNFLALSTENPGPRFVTVQTSSGQWAFDDSRWTNTVWKNQIIANVQQAAALASYAGFKGIALNFEQHQMWRVDANIPNKGELCYEFGLQMGQAIRLGFANASILMFFGKTLVQLPTSATALAAWMSSDYAYFPNFYSGLIQAAFGQFAAGLESTFTPIDATASTTKYANGAGNTSIAISVALPSFQKAWQYYSLDPSTVSIAPGLWAVGSELRDPVTGKQIVVNGYAQYTKRADSSRTPVIFAAQLNGVFSKQQPYLWIFDQGEPWELTPGSPWNPGPLDPNFAAFVNAIHTVKQTYATH